MLSPRILQDYRSSFIRLLQYVVAGVISASNRKTLGPSFSSLGLTTDVSYIQYFLVGPFFVAIFQMVVG